MANNNMIAVYVRINWQNKPSLRTPLNETNLNHVDEYLYNLSNWANSLPNIPTNVSELINDSGYQNALQVNALIKTAINNLGSILIFKGVVSNYAHLPSSGDNGDVYQVIDDSDAPNPHGRSSEYYWTGSKWDYFSSEHKVDLSDYFTKAQIEALLKTKVTSSTIQQIRFNSQNQEFEYTTDNGLSWKTLYSGKTGDTGAVFTPTVDADGNISWENNGNLPNPSTQNIKGPKGDKGFTPSIEKYSENDTEYKLQINNETSSFITPNLKGANGADGNDGDSVEVDVVEDTDTSYKLSFTVGQDVVTTPNLKNDGNMTKAIYDANNDGIVDEAAKVTNALSIKYGADGEPTVYDGSDAKEVIIPKTDLSDYATKKELQDVDDKVEDIKALSVNSEAGAFYLRYYNDKLEIYNSTSSEWEEIITSGGGSIKEPLLVIENGSTVEFDGSKSVTINLDNRASKKEFEEHRDSYITTLDGVHGIRFYNNKLGFASINDDGDEVWTDIIVGGNMDSMIYDSNKDGVVNEADKVTHKFKIKVDTVPYEFDGSNDVSIELYNGDMKKKDYDKNNDGIIDEAAKVSNLLKVILDDKTVEYDGSVEKELDIDTVIEDKVKEHDDKKVFVSPTELIDIEGVHGLRFRNGKLEYFDTDSQAWQKITSIASFPLPKPASFTITKSTNDTALIQFEDSEDYEVDGDTIATWVLSQVVRKVGSAPTSPDDGIVILSNNVRNQYSATAFEDTNIVLDTEYYYALFCTSDNGSVVGAENNPIVFVAGEVLAPNVSNVQVQNGNFSFAITFNTDVVTQAFALVNTLADPEPITKGVRLVLNTDHYPTDENDGIVYDPYASGEKITNLENGKSYYVKLFTYNKYGTYSSGIEVLCEPNETLANDLTDLAVVEGYKKFSVSYTADSTVKGVRLVYGKEAITDANIPTTDGMIIDPYVSGQNIQYLENEVTYHWRLFPYNENKTFNTSETMIGTATPYSPPSNPVNNLTALSGSNEVTLTWEQDETVAGVRIVYSTNPNIPTISSGYVVETTQSPITITGLLNNKKYYFRVFTYNEYKTYNIDDYVLVSETPSDALAEPCANIVAIPGYKSAKVTFDLGEFAESVRLVYGKEPITTHKPTSTTTVIEPYNSGQEIKGLENDVLYYFRLYPKNEYGIYTKNENQEVSCTPKDIVPSIVTIIETEHDDGTVIIKWSGDATVKGVKIAYSNIAYPTSSNGGKEFTTNECTITGLTNETQYYFSVFSINPYGTIREDNYATVTEIPSAIKVYTVKFTGSDPKGERLDDASKFSDVQLMFGPNGTYYSDFDNCYPWSEMKQVFLNADGTESETITDYCMVRIPLFYVKTDLTSEHQIWSIAESKKEGYRPSQAFVKPDGSIRKYIYYSAYKGSIVNSRLISKSGIIPTSNKSLNEYRSAAMKNGNGFHTIDIVTLVDTIFPLFLIEFANRNSQGLYKMTGSEAHTRPDVNGRVDFVGNKSGKETLDNKLSHIRYRGIDNLFYLLYDMIDGAVALNYELYVSDNYKNYNSNGNNYIKVPSFVYKNNYITYFENDADVPWFPVPHGDLPSTSSPNASSSNYYCDGIIIKLVSATLINGARDNLNNFNGLFLFSLEKDPNFAGDGGIGCRLVYTED